MNNIIKFENIQSLIIEIRGKQAIIDSDVAKLYGVGTKRINEAVKNNPDKFPPEYIIRLKLSEWKLLKSKFSSSIKGGKVKLPSAFTEKGHYMLATILKSKKATNTTIAIIETFAKMRKLSRNINELSNLEDEVEKKDVLKKER